MVAVGCRVENVSEAILSVDTGHPEYNMFPGNGG